MADRNSNSGRSDEQNPDLGRNEDSGMSGGSRSGSTSPERGTDRDSLTDTSRDRGTSGDSSSDSDSDLGSGSDEIGEENVSNR